MNLSKALVVIAFATSLAACAGYITNDETTLSTGQKFAMVTDHHLDSVTAAGAIQLTPGAPFTPVPVAMLPGIGTAATAAAVGGGMQALANTVLPKPAPTMLYSSSTAVGVGGGGGGANITR